EPREPDLVGRGSGPEMLLSLGPSGACTLPSPGTVCRLKPSVRPPHADPFRLFLAEVRCHAGPARRVQAVVGGAGQGSFGGQAVRGDGGVDRAVLPRRP